MSGYYEDEQFIAFINECIEKYAVTHEVQHERIVWTDMNEIIHILNQLCEKAPLFNMFLPVRGFERFEQVNEAKEKGFIELGGNHCIIRYVKPKQLILDYYVGAMQWSYFRLESVPTERVLEGREHLDRDYLTELASGEYIDREMELSDDFVKENPGMKAVMRYYRGDFVIVPVESFYNQYSVSTDNGRHNSMNKDEFRFYIEECLHMKGHLKWDYNDYENKINYFKRLYAASLNE